MTEALGQAYRRALARRRAGESTERATITVEPFEPAGKASEFIGIAIVDECWHSDLHDGRSTEFRVDAGEHVVTVHLGRRYRVAGYEGRAKVSLPVVVEPGERLDLVFGVAKEWKPAQTTSFFWPTFLWLAGSLLAFGIGWHVSPPLRWVVASTTAALGMQQPWRNLFGFFVSTKEVTAFVAMYAWLILAPIYISKLARRFNLRMASVASPYVLLRRSDLGKPTDLFKKPYVDPFE